MKPGAIVGFCILGAATLLACVVFFYQRKINKLNKQAKAKFAGRMGQSLANLKSGEGAAAEADLRENSMHAFAKIDKDSSGLISKDELWEYILEKENNMTKEEYDALFKMIDKDGSKQIDFAEFLMFISKLEEKK
jgi:Ca2+-binding EF-hand superfamily protein